MAADPNDGSADLAALEGLHAWYADVVTRAAWAELTGLFCPDAIIEVDTVTAPIRRFVGPQELGTFIGAALERFDHFQLVILNTVAELVSAEDARGRAFISEIRRETATGEWSTTYGLYQDDYRKVGGHWLFADRRYRSLARTGTNAGAFGLPADLPTFRR